MARVHRFCGEMVGGMLAGLALAALWVLVIL